MASSKEYLEFILGQLSELEEITYRAMMGEFIIYYRGKIVGGIYDDRLLVKPVKAPQGYDLDLIAFLGKIIRQKTDHSFRSAFSQAVNMKKNFSAAQSLSSLPLRHHISFIPLLEHKIRPHNTGIISAASSPSIPCFHIIS